ncbi:MAG: hypothetical protein IPG47_10075 [Thermoflexaceae bacterium]|nr:hypothetical protein [Thermoflexaceae bacterium]
MPKAHTPFQWARQETAAELDPKHRFLRDACRSAGVEFSWNDPRDSFIEAVLSAATTASVMIGRHGGAARASTRGASTSRADTLGGGVRRGRVDASWFAHREADTREPLPWDHIETGVTKSYLRGQWQDVLSNQTVPDCHHGSCNVCGMQSFDTLRGGEGRRGLRREAGQDD